MKNLRIRGINLGGWLMMEGYILGGRNIAESVFKEKFRKIYGSPCLREFECLFRDNFIQGQDFRNIAASGANAIRIPFNCRLLESKPYYNREKGYQYLEKALDWAKKYKLGVILDLHAAWGSQNSDWHSDSRGRSFFWQNEPYWQKVYNLWESVADRFKDHPSLIGYDLLNEPVPSQGRRNAATLKRFYRNLIRRIRAIDKQHLIFLEGDHYGQQIDFLEDLLGDNISISIHTYQPLNFTFNFVPFYRFPGKIDACLWNKSKMYKYLEPYFKFSKKNKTRIFVGEFGINWRGGFWGEIEWLKSILAVFEDFGFDYTYWTYKAIANSLYPDGIYQYIPNSGYVRREGAICGWESYISAWKKERKRIVDFWQTKNYKLNTKLMGVLKQSFKLKPEVPEA